eukprot:TRINITY_DN11441_c0_g1_i3.p1 TRINITY_DN11441_c0_g1~~TRINITY_DN11441_c0_g1_i3.p1  ORF type:complete len:357 (-),score=67.60 TRINITY_DN11441_c0_g1_i3:159-1229(-)
MVVALKRKNLSVIQQLIDLGFSDFYHRNIYGSSLLSYAYNQTTWDILVPRCSVSEILVVDDDYGDRDDGTTTNEDVVTDCTSSSILVDLKDTDEDVLVVDETTRENPTADTATIATINSSTTSTTPTTTTTLTAKTTTTTTSGTQKKSPSRKIPIHLPSYVRSYSDSLRGMIKCTFCEKENLTFKEYELHIGITHKNDNSNHFLFTRNNIIALEVLASYLESFTLLRFLSTCHTTLMLETTRSTFWENNLIIFENVFLCDLCLRTYSDKTAKTCDFHMDKLSSFTPSCCSSKKKGCLVSRHRTSTFFQLTPKRKIFNILRARDTYDKAYGGWDSTSSFHQIQVFENLKQVCVAGYV